MGTNKQLPVHGIHHVALRVADFAASVRFYTNGLGFGLTLRFEEDGDTVAFLDAGNGTYLELFSGGSVPGSSGRFLHLALRTDDCDAALERARAAGAKVTIEPTAALLHGEGVAAVRYAFCEGPDGEMIEFLQTNDL